MRRHGHLAALTALMILTVVPPARADEPGPGDHVPWRELRFSAKKLFLSATTTLGLRFLTTKEAVTELARPPRGTAVPPSWPFVAVLTSTTDLPFGRDEEVLLWLDPATGRIAQFDKRVVGSKKYRKLRRFTTTGYYSWRTSPADPSEVGLSPATWTKSREDIAVTAGTLPPGVVLTEGYALLYLVSAARLDRPDSHFEAAVLSDGQLVLLDFRAEALTRIDVAFDEVWPDHTTRRRDGALVRAVRVTGRRADDDSPDDDVDLGLLGMRGALTIYVESGTGLPIELSGRAAKIGNLRVTLTRAVMDAPEKTAAPPAPAR